MVRQRPLVIASVFWVCLAVLAAYFLVSPSSVAAQSVPENSLSTSILFRSVQANDFAGVQKAVSEGADLQARDRWGMTAADIAVDRGYYRIAHFLAAARKPHRDEQTTSGAPSAVPNSVAASSVSRAEKLSPRGARNESPNIDSLSTEEDQPSEWNAGEPNPFDPAAPAPGSQLRTMQAY